LIINKLLPARGEVKNKKSTKSSVEDKDNFIPGTPQENNETSMLKLMKQQWEREDNLRIKESKLDYRNKLIKEMLSRGLLWGAGGFLLLNNVLNPVAAVAGGAITGALLAWDKIKNHDKGTVTVNIDGQKITKPYYMNPNIYEKSPEEKAIIEKVTGQSGDRIYLLDIKNEDMPKNIDKDKIQTIKPYADTLLELGKTRRLVASFGRKSRDGKDVLNLIDANMAKNLIASGKPVYVINATDIEEIPHHYTAVSGNKEETNYAAEAYDFLEKKFNYTLNEINTGEDLADVKDGNGIPPGMWGVYKNGSSCEDILYNKNQYSSADVERTGNSYSRNIMYTASESSKIGLDTVEINEETIKKLKGKIPEYTLDIMGGFFKGSVLTKDVLEHQLRVMLMMKAEDADMVIKAATVHNSPMDTTDGVRPSIEHFMDFSRISAFCGVGVAQALITCSVIPVTYALPVVIAAGIAGYKLGKVLTDKIRVHKKL